MVSYLFFATITISIVAMFLLVIKWIFRDKLTPRWQYGVWYVLLIRMIIPFSYSREILLPINIRYEQLRMLFASSFFAGYGKIILYIYVAGTVAVLLWHAIRYFQMRSILKKAEEPCEALRLRVERVMEKYQLHSKFKIVQVKGLTSAFVCGTFRPVLVLSDDNQKSDEKIILHELLHLKYKDVLQTIVWTVAQAMQWFNPLMYYVLRVIQNDMESLCDQRVLELLEGEERREYGFCLLAMTNNQFARTMGTSSVSNGGKNIAKRIKAIVHFKKFPRGMALVSICLIVILAGVCFVGVPVNAIESYVEYDECQVGDDMDSYQEAKTHMYRCKTEAAAVDAFVKGLYWKNAYYLNTALDYKNEKNIDSLHQLMDVEYQPEYRVINCVEKKSKTNAIILFSIQRGSQKKEWKKYVSKEEYGDKIEDDSQVLMIPVVIKKEVYQGKKCYVVEPKLKDIEYIDNSLEVLVKFWRYISNAFYVEEQVEQKPFDFFYHGHPDLRNGLCLNAEYTDGRMW